MFVFYIISNIMIIISNIVIIIFCCRLYSKFWEG